MRIITTFLSPPQSDSNIAINFYTAKYFLCLCKVVHDLKRYYKALVGGWYAHQNSAKVFLFTNIMKTSVTKAFIEVLEEKSDGKLFLQKIQYTL